MSRTSKQIDTVIFDLDDTLIDWSKGRVPWSELNDPKAIKVHNYLEEAGHQPQINGEAFAQLFNQTSFEAWNSAPNNDWRSPKFETILTTTINGAGIDVAAVDMRAAMEAFEWHKLPNVQLFPDTIPVLTELRAQGYRVGMVTNAYFPMWMREPELERFGIDHLLDAAITSGDTGWLKPHPAIYWRMLGMLNTMPERAVFVGDSPTHDVAGANATGLHSVLHAPPTLDRDREGNVADYEISGMQELLPILAQLD